MEENKTNVDNILKQDAISHLLDDVYKERENIEDAAVITYNKDGSIRWKWTDGVPVSRLYWMMEVCQKAILDSLRTTKID